MSQYETLLLIASSSRLGGPAYERAVSLARSSGAALHVAMFGHLPFTEAVARFDSARATQVRADWAANRRRELADAIQGLRDQGLHVTANAVWTRRPHNEMVAYANELAPDLVIVDVEHQSLLKRLLLRSGDWYLLRDCAVPVLFVGSAAQPLPRRVIAAINVYEDGGTEDSAFNAAIVHAAQGLALQCDADLHLASAAEIPLIDGDGLITAATHPEILTAIRESHDQELARFAHTYSVPADRLHSLSGPAPQALADFAHDAHADVIVVGTHQRHGVDRALLGSVAELIVDVAPCDVLVIKP